MREGLTKEEASLEAANLFERLFQGGWSYRWGFRKRVRSSEEVEALLLGSGAIADPQKADAAIQKLLDKEVRFKNSTNFTHTSFFTLKRVSSPDKKEYVLRYSYEGEL